MPIPAAEEQFLNVGLFSLSYRVGRSHHRSSAFGLYTTYLLASGCMWRETALLGFVQISLPVRLFFAGQELRRGPRAHSKHVLNPALPLLHCPTSAPRYRLSSHFTTAIFQLSLCHPTPGVPSTLKQKGEREDGHCLLRHARIFISCPLQVRQQHQGPSVPYGSGLLGHHC